jgi:hypothetical protein
MGRQTVARIKWCEAFTHSRAAGWFGRQKIWRKAEVLIPNALQRPSRFERAPGTRRVDFPSIGGRLRTRSSSVARPFAFQATLAPWPVSLPDHWRMIFSENRCPLFGIMRGGGVRYRAPHVAVLTVFKTGPAPRWLRLRSWLSLGDSNSVPLVPETSALLRMS